MVFPVQILFEGQMRRAGTNSVQRWFPRRVTFRSRKTPGSDMGMLCLQEPAMYPAGYTKQFVRDGIPVPLGGNYSPVPSPG